jgi:hypothetical protein
MSSNNKLLVSKYQSVISYEHKKSNIEPIRTDNQKKRVWLGQGRMGSPGHLDIETMWFMNAAGNWPGRKIDSNSGD